MNRILALLLLVSSTVHAEPWAVYGQHAMPLAGLNNPKPNSMGVVGAVTKLPYRVPSGHRLVIESQSIESYDAPGIAVLYVWVSDSTAQQSPTIRTSRALISVAAKSGTVNDYGRYVIEEGYWVHVRLVNTQNTHRHAVYGWAITGRLEAIE